MKEPKRVFKGVFVPACLWELPPSTISWMEKVMLAEIDSLDDGEGCWASNEYLAGKMGSTKGSIAVILSRMRKSGWIIHVEKEGDETRLIRVNWKAFEKPKKTPSKPPETDYPQLNGVYPQLNGRLTTVNNSESTIIDEIQEEELSHEINSCLPDGEKEPEQNQVKKKDDFHQKLKDEWCKEYQSRFGGKYYFQGGKDGKAVKYFAGTGMPVEEIILLAKKAWDSGDRFYASNTTSLMGFWSLLNKVQAVVAQQESPALPT